MKTYSDHQPLIASRAANPRGFVRRSAVWLMCCFVMALFTQGITLRLPAAQAKTALMSCPFISINPTSLPDGVKGTAYSQAITATNGAAPYQFIVSSGALPPGITLKGATLSGTPTTVGGFNFRLQATDANGCIGSRAYTITIDPLFCLPITVNPVSMTNATLGAAYSQFLSASGGGGNYYFSVSAGALPPGLQLNGLNGTTLSGTPTALGTYNFTVKATDPNGCFGTRAYSLSVQAACPSIVISPASVAAATVGTTIQPIHFNVNNAQAGYSFSLSAGALPPGLQLNGGVLSGTPTTAGAYNFTIKATDSKNCTGVRAYTMAVNQKTCPTLTINPAALPSAKAGAVYTQSLSASGGAAPYQFSLSAGALPPGLSLQGNVITGTPTSVGGSNFTIKVTDANGCFGTQSYSFSVACPTVTITPGGVSVATVGVEIQPVTFAAHSDVQGNGYAMDMTMFSGFFPDGLQVTGNGLGTAFTLSGKPTKAGSYTFVWQVDDSFKCNTKKSFTWVVNPVCPTITVSPASIPAATVGTAIQPITFTTNVGNYEMVLDGGALPPGLQFNGAARTLSGTPQTAGTYSFTLKVTDANKCTGSKTYTMTVNPKTCPTITLSPAGLPPGSVNTAYSQSLAASGGTAPYQYSVSAGNLPVGLSLNPNGALTGTPTEPGATSFTLKAVDANGCQTTRAYSLTIAPAPLANVSAASYQPGAAPDSIVAAFGVKLAEEVKVADTQPLPTELANVTVSVKDNFGTERLAPLFFVSPGQINYLIPPGTATGMATVSVYRGDDLVAAGSLEITMVAPGLFTANANGQGVPSAVALRVKSGGELSYETIAEYKNNQFTCKPIDLGSASEQVFLVLYGTGLRYRSNLSAVVTTLGGNVNGDVLFVGDSPGFVGLDQVNVRIPRTLIGRGEIDIALMAEGKAANVVRVNVQ